jgi:hypothetical protein
VAEKGAKGPIFEGNMLPPKKETKIGANIGAMTGILLIFWWTYYTDTIYLYILYNICQPSSGHEESFYAHFDWCIARVLGVNYSLWLTAFVLWPSYNGHVLGVHFSRGHISLKNRTYCPLFSHNSTSFKGTCLLMKLKSTPRWFVWVTPTAL